MGKCNTVVNGLGNLPDHWSVLHLELTQGMYLFSRFLACLVEAVG